MNTLNTPDPYGKRPYQQIAIKNIVHHTTGLVQDRLMLDAANEDMSQKYPTAALLEMATGSGKTYTNGKILEKILNIRERYNRIHNTTHFQGLNILVLSNRIDGVNQFRDDLFHGKEGKNPILSEKLRRQSRIRTFHSKADNLDDIDPRYFTQDEADEYEDLAGESSEVSDTFYFSTAQTAGLKSLDEKLPYIDMIIVDEAHNVLPGNDMDLILEKLTLRGRDGATPMILALTATPTNLTKELFGEAKYRFPLPEYLASGYAPDVRYHLVTATTASEDAISSLKAQVDMAKSCTDPMTKKQLVQYIKKDFEDIMAKYPDIDSLVGDLLEKRIGTDPETVGQTIIFVNNTDEADEVAKTINKKYGTEVALSYHSYNDRKQSVTWSSDRKNGLERFAHAGDPIRIIVCVDKLNESVDVPTVENVVFWRGTDIEKVFLQQFGRGMRGNGIVNYYDYVGGLRNFAWIGDLYEEYRGIISTGGGGSGGGLYPSEFALLGGNTRSDDRLIDLSDIGFTIKTLSDETKHLLGTTPDEIIETLGKYNIKTGDELMKKGVGWFQKTFGVSDLGKFLGRTISGGVTKDHLIELSTKLGWDIYSTLGITKEVIILSLKKHGITNGGELIENGPVWFTSKFGVTDIGKYLGRILKKIKKADLIELSERLGWQIKALGTRKEEITLSLEKYGVINGDELIKRGPTWFQSEFGLSDIGKYLGRILKKITKSDLIELSAKLGWESTNPKEQIIVSLEKYGVTNENELIKRGPKWFISEFGLSDIGKILGRSIRSGITKADLIELSAKLGWESTNPKERIIVSLEKYGVTNGDELIKRGPIWFKKTFGVSDPGKFLGRKLGFITKPDLIELSEKLWGESESKQ